MTTVRSTHCGNAIRMTRCCKPVMNGGTDLPALHRRFARTMMSRDQQQDAVPVVNRVIEAAIDRAPGTVQSQAMKVEHAVRFDVARAKTPIPAAVQR